MWGPGPFIVQSQGLRTDDYTGPAGTPTRASRARWRISNELLTFDGKGHTPDLQENGFFNDKLFDDVVGFVLRNTYIADCQLVPE